MRLYFTTFIYVSSSHKCSKEHQYSRKKIEDASRKDSPWEPQPRDLFVVDPQPAFSDKNNLRIGEE